MKNKISGPWAQSVPASRREPLSAEVLSGFACGPLDLQLFNELFYRLSQVEAEAVNLIAKSGWTPDENDLTQLAKAIRSQHLNYVATPGGTANAVTATLDPAPATLTELVGTPLQLKMPLSNTATAVTLNVNGLGAKTIVLPGGFGPPIRAWDPNDLVEVVYNGTYWVVSGNLRGASYTRLSAPLTIYVNGTTGNNSNDGLTPGTAFQSIQYASDYVQRRFDLAGFQVTISIASATYTVGATVNGAYVGATGPDSVNFAFAGGALNVTNGTCFASNYGAQFRITGPVTLTATGTGANQGCAINCNTGYIQFGGVTFGSCQRFHIACGNAGFVSCISNYTISSNAQSHVQASSFGVVQIGSVTITLTGTPAFLQYYAQSSQAYLDLSSCVFSGAGTGFRYFVDNFGVIYTGGAGASYLPGSGAGTATAFGRYN